MNMVERITILQIFKKYIGNLNHCETVIGLTRPTWSTVGGHIHKCVEVDISELDMDSSVHFSEFLG